MTENDQSSSVLEASSHMPGEKGTFDTGEIKKKRTDYAEASSESPNITSKLDNPNIETQIPEDSQIKLEEAATEMSRPSLPVAISIGSQRNILILGTARAGKYTIAKHIATDDSQHFPKQDTEKGICVLHRYKCDNYKFVTIDTAGANSKQYVNEHIPSASSVKSSIESYLEHGINLILVVVRRDCCSPEDLNFLVSIVNNLFNSEARNYIALVHTGCEILEDPQRKAHIEKFAKTAGPAERLSSICQKGSFSVGFPDLEKVDKKYFQLYNDSVIKGKQELRSLVKDSKFIQPYTVLLKTTKLWFYQRDQLLPDSANYQRCALM